MRAATEKCLSLASGPAQTLLFVMKDGAGGAAFEAAPRTVVEIMGGDFHRQGKVSRRIGCVLQPLVQGGFETADDFFLRSVVARKMGWIVQGQHAEASHDLIHRLAVEGRAVVAFWVASQDQPVPTRASECVSWRGVDPAGNSWSM